MARPADPHARSALLRAARLEIAKRGLRAARIEDITAACGLSKGAFYLHFPSKEALFRQLVESFVQEMEQMTDERMKDMECFTGTRLKPVDLRQGGARYEELLALDTRHDLRLLELMWSERDILNVLMSGVAGTEFEGLFWDITSREAARVTQDFRKMQKAGICRQDVQAELFGALIVGTYSQVLRQLGQAKKKPDLKALATSLHRLLHEGSAPPTAPALAPRRSPKKSPQRSRS